MKEKNCEKNCEKKERLSKLQKFILQTCCNSKFISRRILLNGYFGKITPAAEASLSRSLWILLERDYISGLSPMKVSNMAVIYSIQGKSLEDFKKDYGSLKPNEKIASFSQRGFNKIKIISITDKGREKIFNLKVK